MCYSAVLYMNFVIFDNTQVVQKQLLSFIIQSIFTLTQMESSLQVISSLVPLQEVVPYCALSAKYWHLIYSGQFIIPKGTYSLKVSVYIVWWNSKFYIEVNIEEMPMLGSCQESVEGVVVDAKALGFEDKAIPLGYYNFENQCLTCLLAADCPEHNN